MTWMPENLHRHLTLTCSESKNMCFASSINLRGFGFQEKRRAERAEQQRIRAERDKERQARREVGQPSRGQDAHGRLPGAFTPL